MNILTYLFCFVSEKVFGLVYKYHHITKTTQINSTYKNFWGTLYVLRKSHKYEINHVMKNLHARTLLYLFLSLLLGREATRAVHGFTLCSAFNSQNSLVKFVLRSF